MPLSQSHRRLSSVAALATILVVSAGCQSVPEQPEGLPPSLQLLDAAQLDVPAGCVPETSVRVQFVVLESGRTEQVRAADGPECLRAALTVWVGSFLYAPPPAPVEESVEWLLVTARRGS
jgi:hypothetical protein